MNITFEELRKIKDQLPDGSIHQIAEKLGVSDQTVRNYFGGANYREGEIADYHIEQGPGGGVVHLEDTKILDLAKTLISSES